ncbi:unnamed protein product, partial [Vitis vinifera]
MHSPIRINTHLTPAFHRHLILFPLSLSTFSHFLEKDKRKQKQEEITERGR